MNNELLILLGMTLDLIGTLLIALTAIRVHHTLLKDKRIDDPVFREIKHEYKWGFLGIGFVILGYILELLFILR